MTTTQIITFILLNTFLIPMLYVHAKEIDTNIKRKQDARKRSYLENTLLILVCAYTVCFGFNIVLDENAQTTMLLLEKLLNGVTVILLMVVFFMTIRLAHYTKIDNMRLLITMLTLAVIVLTVIV